MTVRQQPLYRDRRASGFWANVRIGATIDIDDTAWLEALRKGEIVGTCRGCGGYLRPGTPYQTGPVKWYPGTCTTCRYETAAHGPRPAKKTIAKSQNGGLA